ncbi:XRE family transcriptional regulator [Streptomyces resistomycificus]|uniref:XRE family transcriptional regulator n=1 Tax=Streptomyces resistomycificus TaxID=67356 RepID=UPI000A760286|nr:XRE family transcriptional regulator [Streptomyces resistomycificus]
MAGESAAFGALLRELRLAASLTLEGLAETSGVSVRGIGDLERGRRAAPQRRTVAALADGLGLAEPGRERLLAAARAGRCPGYSPAGVRAFPRGIADFVGRERESARLRELARGAGSSVGGTPSRPPVVAAVSGPPGAGKTTLVLHAARELADHFPDGQFLVDLRGMEDAPPEPAELMLGVLKALGVADRDLAKAGPQGHPGLYRQVLADRRCLLVLDNARDEAQVRPLLPGGGAVLVLVTSRRMLTGLESVHRLPLGELSADEAAVFLTGLVGAERAGADPAALAEVAERCGHCVYKRQGRPAGPGGTPPGRTGGRRPQGVGRVRPVVPAAHARGGPAVPSARPGGGAGRRRGLRGTADRAAPVRRRGHPGGTGRDRSAGDGG